MSKPETIKIDDVTYVRSDSVQPPARYGTWRWMRLLKN
jgi:hypothetical protein